MLFCAVSMASLLRRYYSGSSVVSPAITKMYPLYALPYQRVRGHVAIHVSISTSRTKTMSLTPRPGCRFSAVTAPAYPNDSSRSEARHVRGCWQGRVKLSSWLNTYLGASDTGPRTFIARVNRHVRAVVVALSDGTREDLILHAVKAASGLRVGVLVYPSGLDIHRVDLFGHSGELLPPEA
jgi:hypothetical protein